MTECIERFILPPNGLPPNQPITSHMFIKEADEIDNFDYRLESARLQSFRSWPCPWMKPEKLATSGFYYTGEGDKVKCFECQVEICQWQADDNPMVDHQRWSGRCRFVRNIPCGNVPIGTDPSTIPAPMPKGVDVCGPYGVVYMPYSGPDNDLEDAVKLSLGGLTTVPTRPKHPECAGYDARLSTFDTWPKAMAQTKEELATAGFYYTGNGDQTLCYYCGGGLRDWDPEDDVWEQHAKWFDHCPYLLMVKGRDFVSKITGRKYFTPDANVFSKWCGAYCVPTLLYRTRPTIRSAPRAKYIRILQILGYWFFQKMFESSGTGELNEKAYDEGIASGSSQNSEDTDIESIESGVGSEGSIEEQPTVKVQREKGDKDARMCKICYNRELRMVFIPCGHLLACAECAKNMNTCGVCRKPVKVTVQAYIP